MLLLGFAVGFATCLLLTVVFFAGALLGSKAELAQMEADDAQKD